MGYNTDFTGELYIRPELNVLQMTALSDLIEAHQFTAPYLQLLVGEDINGQFMEWDGTEKTYDMVDQIAFVIQEMRKIVPDFGFVGEFFAQGESNDDRWILKVSGEQVEKFNIRETGQEVKCPSCHHTFTIPYGDLLP